MTWDSIYFKREEFACKCGCGFDTVDFALVRGLDKIREHFGKPVTINSGCRCESHNRVIKGAKGSQHLRGRAADIVVKDIDPILVVELADTLGFGGIHAYDTFTHVDTRHGKVRWNG
jgi:uncharacterized protein YcbK (DUF882 family)|tara:strand:+ start:1080 stop:1430 length:351 start_codon:yes stop_codon:yes gene_type:complete